MVSSADDRLAAIAARLDRLADVPTEVLAEIVLGHGACMWCYGEGEPPAWTGSDTADRDLAARICAGCPVQDHCLELELRWAGPDTAGVWGALSDVDRRALHPLWLARRNGDTAPDPSDSTGRGEQR